MDDRFSGLRGSYDEIAEEYATRIAGELDHKPLDRALLAALAEMVGPGGKVADIGCGPGHVGAYLSDRGLRVMGIDLSPGMIGIAERLNPQMSFRVGNMLSLPVSDGSLDGLVAFYSIIHLRSDEIGIAFREFFRVLVPGGLALLAFHAGDERVHRDEWWGHQVDVDTNFYQRKVVERTLQDEGFVVQAALERLPDEAAEYPSRRAYVLARRPQDS